MKYILISISVLMLFAGCSMHDEAYLKMIRDPNSDYNKYEFWRYYNIFYNTSYEDKLQINTLTMTNNTVEIDISYYQNKRSKIDGCTKEVYERGGNSYVCHARVNLKNKVEFYKNYSLDVDHLEVDIFAQNSECSYDKLNLKREILSKNKLKFNIPQKYKNSYIKFIFKTKGLKKNIKAIKSLNMNKLC